MDGIIDRETIKLLQSENLRLSKTTIDGLK